MSSHTIPQNPQPSPKPLTSLDVRQSKGKKKVTVLTAYDFTSAQIADAGGVDCILVGDSLGMVMLGRKDTLSVTLEEMIHHARAVVAGTARALVIADMPFMTYERGAGQALDNAAEMVQRSGVRTVKLEGGRLVAPQVRALVDAGIPVMGHIGLTPQRAPVLGGFKVQGKTAAAAETLLEDALSLQDAGCYAIVLEAIPSPVAERITRRLAIPTIGIGAGPQCDGQVLVFHDMLGLNTGHVPRFVKKFADMAACGRAGVEQYVKEVRDGTFPSEEHSYCMADEELHALKTMANGEGQV